MEQAEGIGLAAQQIGQALQFCVVDVPEHPDYPMTCILDGKPLSPSLVMPMALANPKITPLPSDEYYQEEGCLSFPFIRVRLHALSVFQFAIRIWRVIPIIWNATVCLPAAFSMKSIICTAFSLLTAWKKRLLPKSSRK